LIHVINRLVHNLEFPGSSVAWLIYCHGSVLLFRRGLSIGNARVLYFVILNSLSGIRHYQRYVGFSIYI
jgi:hypothetical protein